MCLLMQDVDSFIVMSPPVISNRIIQCSVALCPLLDENIIDQTIKIRQQKQGCIGIHLQNSSSPFILFLCQSATMKGDQEVEFDSICFHQECIKQGEQLFSQSNYSQALTHAIHKELCMSLDSEVFQKFYDIPHRLAPKLMRKFETSLEQEIQKREKEHEVSFIRVYKDQAKKAYLTCMNKFAFNGCTKMLKKLMNKKKVLKIEETTYLTNLFEQRQGDIELSMEIKVNQLIDQLNELSQRILTALQQKIKEIFFEAFSEIPIKEEEDSSSYSQFQGQIMQLNQPDLSFLQSKELGDDQEIGVSVKEEYITHLKEQHIEQCPIESEHPSSGSQTAKKMRKPRTKHLDARNILQCQRPKRNGKVNYYNYHQYGNHSKEDFFEKAYIINSVADIRDYAKSKNKEVVQYNVLVINWKIEFEDLIELIKFIKPRRIKINAQIVGFQENLLEYIPKPILHSLVQFDQCWDLEYFAISYPNCVFTPRAQRSFPPSKANITSEHWNSLFNMENMWISSLSDIQAIIDSSKTLENLKCLKIHPLNVVKISAYDIKPTFGELKKLNTLIIKNMTFDAVFNEFVMKLLKNNPLKCLVLKNIKGITVECIEQISRMGLKQLILHFNQAPQDINFNCLLRIFTLKYFSIKGISMDATVFRSGFYDVRYTLKNVEHFDLSYSGLTLNGIVKCLHSVNHKIPKYLNLEGNALSSQIAYTLKDFTSLNELNISKTSMDLLAFLRKIDEPIRSLEKVSLLGYYDTEDDRMTDHQLLLEDQALELLFHKFPNIKFLNVSSPQSVPKARFYCPFSSLAVNGVQQSSKKKK